MKTLITLAICLVAGAIYAAPPPYLRNFADTNTPTVLTNIIKSMATNVVSQNASGGFTNTITSTITYGTTITPALNIDTLTTQTPRKIIFRLTMTGNVTTVAAPTGTAVDGDVMEWEVIQDATGNRTITGFNSIYGFGTDITGITLTTNASKRDFILWGYNSTATKWFCKGFVRGY